MAQDSRAVNPLASELKTLSIAVGNEMQLTNCRPLEPPPGERLGELSENGLAVL